MSELAAIAGDECTGPVSGCVYTGERAHHHVFISMTAMMIMMMKMMMMIMVRGYDDRTYIRRAGRGEMKIWLDRRRGKIN